jgi:hypothetical protein
MIRSFRLATVALFTLSAGTMAQQRVPPAAPTIGASGGFGAGIAIPVGRLSDTHAAGYSMMGLVDFSAADQPYSFRAELVYQHYDHKTSGDGAALKNKNVVSLGASLLLRTPRQQASAYLLGGIGIYNATDEGTKPGLDFGAGLEVPLTFFVGFADVRTHFVLSEGRKLVTVPITLGARF